MITPHHWALNTIGLRCWRRKSAKPPSTIVWDRNIVCFAVKMAAALKSQSTHNNAQKGIVIELTASIAQEAATQAKDQLELQREYKRMCHHQRLPAR